MSDPMSLDGTVLGAHVVPRLADLVGAWELDRLDRPRPTFAAIRSFCDYHRAYPQLLVAALADKPAASGWTMFDSLLAGIAEALADDAGVPRAPWTATVPAVQGAWPRAAAAVEDARRSSTPAALLDRGIVIDADSLWHSWPIYDHA